MAAPSATLHNQQSAVLDDPLTAAVQQRDQDILNGVRDALDRNDTFLVYQPIVSAHATDKIAFYEGLIRIVDDTGRVIPAKEFIHTVENQETGRIIDCLALQSGLRTLAERPDLRISVNMSARSIGYPRWMETFRKGVASQPTIAERLIVEITESSAMAAPDTTCAFMDSLQNYGVSFALDDFGSGYTSFRYLKDFFFDIIKIDQGFVSGIQNDPDNRVLVRALVSIAQHFEMFVVAEGIEHSAEAQVLRDLGVDCFQGYLFGSPASLPAAASKKKWRNLLG